MGFFSKDDEVHRAHEEYNGMQTKHKDNLTHDILGGAAAVGAAKLFEDYRVKHGHPDDHAKTIEVLSGFAGSFLTHEYETRGLDFIDKRKAQKIAEEHLHRQAETERREGRTPYN